MILHAATIALSAFLLFLVQPIIARQILPWFGGSAAVWTTCMVFFQVALLAGYFYSDVVIRKLAPRRQAIVHTVLLLASLAFLPITVSESMKPVDASQPVGRILLLLAVTIGLPYLMLATTGPLVQAWFSRRFEAARVYRLYALSNLASMIALLGYPPLIEPNASGRMQSIGWSAGYAVFVVLAIAAGWSGARAAPARRAEELAAADAHGEGLVVPPPPAGAASVPAAAPTLREQALWLTLAALGSTVLLAVTTHITQNVASIPFLWVLPLSLYLITFILCFDGTGWYRRRAYLLATAVFTVLMLGGLSFRPEGFAIERAILHIEQAVPVYAVGLFVLCMFAHGELVARKPAPAHLTRFYLMVSLGGAVGGLLVGIAAPLAFAWYWELPLALTLIALLVGLLSAGWLRAVGFVATVACAALFVDYVDWIRGGVLELSRNFYGTLRVTGSADGDTSRDASRRLLHGVILHGEQYMAPDRRAEATTYYGPSSGVGRTIEAARRPSMRVGVIGLGVGTLATYGREGDTYRLYELNPVVLDVAKARFTYLSDSRATLEPALGDARLVLERESPQRFDVLAVDAFSSDSIPVHLLTREALAVYRRHLAPGGAVVFHITNRYLDLTGVVRQLADEAGLVALRFSDSPPQEAIQYRSDWVALTADAALVERLRAAGGEDLPATRGAKRPWTDDHHNLFEVLK
ncbi:MAG: hypothetical protein RJA99_2972 [Pseudomonadota bacterium]|jgi:SAM-dependent methyltransferase